MSDLTQEPAFSFCPKCGSPKFKSKDTGRSYFCEKCDFQYFINGSAAVACLIFNSKGELLLTRRAVNPNKGMLDLPGGFVEPMETLEEAVRREILEELNVVVIGMNYLTSYPNLYPFSGFTVPTIDVAYICNIKNFDDLHPGDDVASVEFVNLNILDYNALCSDSMRKIIECYRKLYL